MGRPDQVPLGVQLANTADARMDAFPPVGVHGGLTITQSPSSERRSDLSMEQDGEY